MTAHIRNIEKTREMLQLTLNAGERAIALIENREPRKADPIDLEQGEAAKTCVTWCDTATYGVFFYRSVDDALRDWQTQPHACQHCVRAIVTELAHAIGAIDVGFSWRGGA